MQNEQSLIKEISQKCGFELKSASALSGGSINQVYLLNTSEGKKVIKINDSSRFPGMFQAEKEVLEELKKSSTVDVPLVLEYGQVENKAYLLLEYKGAGRQKPHFWQRFAEDLAALHKTSASGFGFGSFNYIGSLPQYNVWEETAAKFYINQRLEPQFKMASANGFSFTKLDVIYKNISVEIPAEPPALLHGDLWSGNYITNAEGLPCLIDPAVSYGPREMDLAMMKLFGGFPEQVFKEYSTLFPLQPGFERRVPLWQLYYLLVHLNIFGSSYLPSVREILNKFS